MEQQRALLDQLMGCGRNLDFDEKKKFKKSWKDPDICQKYLCGLCPHELFTNTKSDLGRCPNYHNDKLVAGFKKESELVQVKVEKDYIRYLKGLSANVDRRVLRMGMRLNAKFDGESMNDEVATLHARISTMNQQMEEFSEEGKVEESKTLFSLIQTLREKKNKLIDDQKKLEDRLYESDQKSMEICKICGVWILTAENRRQSHFNGKQHTGYQQIRNMIARIEQKHKDYFESMSTKQVDIVKRRLNNMESIRGDTKDTNRNRKWNSQKERQRNRNKDRDRRRSRSPKRKYRDRYRERRDRRKSRSRRHSRSRSR